MDPRPLTGEPLPLDLVDTVWIDPDGTRMDLLEDAGGTRAWLDGHGLGGPDDVAARRALRESREALRALLTDRTAPQARAGVDAVLRRGAERPRLTAEGTVVEVDAPAAWRTPWRCARELVALLDARGDRVRRCANPGCVLWFVDTSRPGTRRWCSMAACGNRDKALRHGRVRR